MSRFAPLKYRDYRLLWVGSLISWTGSEMSTIALTWMLYQMTGSAVALGLLGLSRAVPMILFALIGGSVADRFDRKRIVLIAQIVFSIISLFVLCAAFLEVLRPWMIYLVTFLQNVIASFVRPARLSLLPHLVEKKDFSKAIQLSTTMWQATILLGPALGGFLMGYSGPLMLLVIDFLSFIPFIICIYLMRTTSRAASVTTTESGTSLLEGLRFVIKKRIIIGTMVLDFLVSFFAMAKSVFPLYADQVYHSGEVGLGLLHSSIAAGALIAGIITNPRWYDAHEGRVLVWSVIGVGAATMIFAYAPTLWLACLALGILGAADFISMNIRMLVRQLNTPDHLMGRVSGVHTIFAGGGPALGELEAGFMASLLGVQHSVFVGGILAIISAAIVSRRVPEIIHYAQSKDGSYNAA